MMKLPLEYREALVDVSQTETWAAILAFCNYAVRLKENRVVTSDIRKTDREIVLAQAELEGAREVERMFNNIRNHITDVNPKREKRKDGGSKQT